MYAEIAREVIDGKWGNGEERKKKLEAAGYNNNEVQSMVNILMKYNKNAHRGTTAVGLLFSILEGIYLCFY